MSDKAKVYVAGAGMITAVGANTAMTTASVKAGINRYQDSEIINHHIESMKMASVPEGALEPLNKKLELLSGLTSRVRRMVRLAGSALQEVMGHYQGKTPLPLFISLPESNSGYTFSVPGNFIDCLMLQSGVTLDKSNCRVIPTGRAGGIQAIDLAFKYFEASGLDYALVGGVDTYRDLMLMEQLEQEGRLLDQEIMDGFIPGEAAGFLLLVSEQGKQKIGSALPELYPPGVSSEQGHRYSEKTYTGDGLAKSFRIAIQNSDETKILSVYSSMNGENFGAKECGVAMIRNNKVLSEECGVEHPADCFGDIGAAFAPVLIGLITSMKHKGANLAYCSSENEVRGTVCVVNA